MDFGDDEERRRRWRAHCLQMAEARYALADDCDDLEMLRAYVDEAARWVKLSEEHPPA